MSRRAAAHGHGREEATVLTDSERVQVRLILGCSLAMREQGNPAREMPSPAEDL